MKKRKPVILLAWLLSIGVLGAVLWQRNQLTSLRAAQIQTSSSGTESATVTSVGTEAQSDPDQDSASSELLKLRAQVTQLTARKRELAGVAEESEKLKVQLAAGSTNSGLPMPGYIRRNRAQFLVTPRLRTPCSPGFGRSRTMMSSGYPGPYPCRCKKPPGRDSRKRRSRRVLQRSRRDTWTGDPKPANHARWFRGTSGLHSSPSPSPKASTTARQRGMEDVALLTRRVKIQHGVAGC